MPGVDGGVGEGNALRVNGRDQRLLHVLGDVDDHGAGTTGAGEVKGLLEDARQIVGVEHEVGVLHDRQGHAEEVGFLEGAFADVFLENLSGDGHHRGGIHEGVGDGRDEIGGAGAAGGHAHADLAGGAGVALGGERAALFVAGEDDADFVGAGQGLVQLLGSAARIGEDDVHPFARQALDDDVGAFHFTADFGLGKRGGRGGGFHGVDTGWRKRTEKSFRPPAGKPFTGRGGRVWDGMGRPCTKNPRTGKSAGWRIVVPEAGIEPATKGL